MTISQVQFVSGTSSINAQSATLGAAPTNGNLLVACLWRRRFGTITPGSGWSLITDAINMNPVASQQSGILWKVAGSGESATQSPGTWSGTPAESRVTIAEYSGLSATPHDVDYTGKTSMQSATVTQDMAITPTAGGEVLIVGIWHKVNGGNYTNPTDTIVDQGLCDTSAAPQGLMMYKVVATASGAYTLSVDRSPADNWGGALASFLAGGGGGGATPRTILAAVIG